MPSIYDEILRQTSGQRIVRSATHAWGVVSGSNRLPYTEDFLSAVTRKMGRRPTVDEERLHRVVSSLRHDGQLTSFGTTVANISIQRGLIQTIEHERDMETWSSKIQERLPPVVVITGLYRAGTTFLHRTLANDPDMGHLPMWLMLRPSPVPKDLKPNIRAIQAVLDRQYWATATPAVEDRHQTGPFLPEEETALFQAAFSYHYYWHIAPTLSFTEWDLATDDPAPYQMLRQKLQLFQAASPRDRWVLKTPAHMPKIETLLKVFPEATVVQLHRDPARSELSYQSLVAALHQVPTGTGFRKSTWKMNARCLELGLQRMMTASKRDPERFVHLLFEDLIRDPMLAVDRIYQRIGAVRPRQLEPYKRSKRPSYRIHSDMYGDNADTIRARHAAYIQEYDIPLAVSR